MAFKVHFKVKVWPRLTAASLVYLKVGNRLRLNKLSSRYLNLFRWEFSMNWQWLFIPSIYMLTIWSFDSPLNLAEIK